jgi:hypothetical protein
MDVVFAELDDDHLRRRLAELILPYLESRATSSTVQPDPWLDAKQAAAYLGITRTALHKHTAARSIPFEQERPGCKCWFKPSELDEWRRGQTAHAAKTQPRPQTDNRPLIEGQRKTAR